MERSQLLLTSFCIGTFLFFVPDTSLSSPRRAAATPSASATAAQEEFDDAMDKARLNFNKRNYEDALKFYKRARASPLHRMLRSPRPSRMFPPSCFS